MFVSSLVYKYVNAFVYVRAQLHSNNPFLRSFVERIASGKEENEERRKSQLLRAWEVGFRRDESPLDSSIIADPQFSEGSNKATIQRSVSSTSLSAPWPAIKIQPTIVLRRAEIFLQIAATASLHFYFPPPRRDFVY